jgi:hypothetical protein
MAHESHLIDHGQSSVEGPRTTRGSVAGAAARSGPVTGSRHGTIGDRPPRRTQKAGSSHHALHRRLQRQAQDSRSRSTLGGVIHVPVGKGNRLPVRRRGLGSPESEPDLLRAPRERVPSTMGMPCEFGRCRGWCRQGWSLAGTRKTGWKSPLSRAQRPYLEVAPPDTIGWDLDRQSVRRRPWRRLRR